MQRDEHWQGILADKDTIIAELRLQLKALHARLEQQQA